ncbi:GNAT family N-acetyltransferase [Micromonospora sp. NPDC048887]|uniref:GNAT family N-acetyltransferase n=1 Tax=unclassified Micromonospora TaxID=2617518 RepID=UPI0033E60C2C
MSATYRRNSERVNESWTSIVCSVGCAIGGEGHHRIAISHECGYHLRAGVQGRGFATEAAAACRDHARCRLGVDRLVAIIHPDNAPSKRVAERIGLSFERATTSESGDPAHVYAARLA